MCLGCAWLHLPLNLVAAALLGLRFALPMALLWLPRDLESAIGFHITSARVQFVASSLFVHRLWFA